VIQPRALFLLAVLFSATASAENSLTIGVASNFLGTAQDIADAFTERTGAAVRLSSGSTGKLYAQIVNGAPYDIFLAADLERPGLLEKNGLAVEGSLYPYADGVLVLVSADPRLEEQGCSRALRNGSYRTIAIANPDIAPYGAAAKAYLQATGIWDDARSRMVMGENILQTYQFVATGNATLGMVAASQLVVDDSPIEIVCRWTVNVPENKVVHQGGVILHGSENKELARSFMKFLRSDQAKTLMITRGYEVPVN